jgi:hypothetical protein
LPIEIVNNKKINIKKYEHVLRQVVDIKRILTISINKNKH